MADPSVSKNTCRSAFNNSQVSLFSGNQFYDIRTYIQNYFTNKISFKEVSRPPAVANWNKKVRISPSGIDIPASFDDVYVGDFVAFKCQDGVLYFNIIVSNLRK